MQEWIMKEGRKEAGEKRQRRVEMQMAGKRGHERPTDSSVQGKGEEKCPRWSTHPLSFPGTKIRLELKPGPAVVHKGILPTRSLGRNPRGQSNCPGKEGEVICGQMHVCGFLKGVVERGGVSIY